MKEQTLYLKEQIPYYRGITLFVSIICVISNASYYPVFVANGIGRIVAIAVWILLVISLMARGIGSASTTYTQNYTILYFIFVLNTVLSGAVNDVNAFSNHFFQPVTIAFVIFITANRLGVDLDSSELKKILDVYYYSMVVISVLLYLYYLRGTEISTTIYGYRFGKNEIAVLLLCALIIACTSHEADNLIKRIIRLIGIIFFIGDILLLRTRSAMFGIVLLLGVVVFNRKTIKRGVRGIIILGLIAFTVYFMRNPSSYYSFLNQIVYAGRSASDLNDLSSGRGTQIMLGWEAFINSPIVGTGKRFTLDCFYVSALANYGLLVWPLYIMSLMPIMWSIKNTKKGDDISICFFVISLSIFIISLLEELAPFGSGTRCYILWLMWGIMTQHESMQRD